MCAPVLNTKHSHASMLDAEHPFTGSNKAIPHRLASQC